MRKARLLSMEGNTSSPESTTVPSTPWIIDTVLLILLILLIFLLFLCYFVPSFLYNASAFLQPSSIKKCVNYFDVLLIIIAISSHLLSRYGSRSSSDRDNEIVTSEADTYSSKERFYDAQQKFGKGSLKRISNSYPDLRNESLWRIEEYGSRFFDDFDVDMYRPVEVNDHCSCARRGRKKKVDSSVKEIAVDNFVVHPPSPPKSPPPLPPKDSLPIQTSHIQDKKIQTQLKSTDVWNFSEEIMSKRRGMKKSSSAKELATAIASQFISQRERKRKQKMRNLHSSQNESTLSMTMEPEPSASKVPPPPPPPPPSIFYNLFKRGRKIKRIQTVNSTPPPPPPLPQRSVLNNLFKNGNVSKRFQSKTGLALPPSSIIKSGCIREQLQLVSASTPPTPPPLPPYVIFNNTFQSGSESKRFHSVSSPSSPPPPLISKEKMNYNDGDQSAAVDIRLLLLPPPPPLSEQELADEMNSAGNGCDDLPCFGSPPVEEDVNIVPSTIESTSGRDVSGWMICPTPDVNMKADSFIARLRGEWKEDGDHEFLERGREL